MGQMRIPALADAVAPAGVRGGANCRASGSQLGKTSVLVPGGRNRGNRRGRFGEKAAAAYVGPCTFYYFLLCCVEACGNFRYPEAFALDGQEGARGQGAGGIPGAT